MLSVRLWCKAKHKVACNMLSRQTEKLKGGFDKEK